MTALYKSLSSRVGTIYFTVSNRPPYFPDDLHLHHVCHRPFCHAVGRVGQPQEAADATLWLASDAASYVVGHSLIVDGGWTCHAR